MNYVEKDGAIVGVPELAIRFADPLSKRCCAIGCVTALKYRLANTIRGGVFLSRLSLLAVEVYPKSDRTMVVRGHTRSRGGGPKGFIYLWDSFFPP